MTASGRLELSDGASCALWTLAVLTVLLAAARRWGIQLPALVLLGLSALGGIGAWVAFDRLVASREAMGMVVPAAPPRTRSRAGVAVGFSSAIVAFVVGLLSRHRFRLEIIGGSADLAHHADLVAVLSSSGLGRLADELPSLAGYPIGAHYPAALFEQMVGLGAVRTTYLFGQLAIVALFSAIAWVSFQLSPGRPWVTAAVLVWIGAAWRPLFVDAVESQFFYSQIAGLALVTAAVAGAQARRMNALTIAWLAATTSAVAVCYPTYLAIALPVAVFGILRREGLRNSDGVVWSVVACAPALLAGALSAYVDQGSRIAAVEGSVFPISANYYFGGPVLLVLALLSTTVVFGLPRPEPGHRGLSRLLDGRLAVARVWLLASVGFLAVNYGTFLLGAFGSRYNTIKCFYPVMVVLAVLLPAFAPRLVPRGALRSVPTRLRPVLAAGAALLVAVWSGRFSPTPPTIRDDQIKAVDFAERLGVPFGSIEPSPVDYVLTVPALTLDPSNERASRLLGGAVGPPPPVGVYVQLNSPPDEPPPRAAVRSPDGAPLTVVCRFGSVTVLARPQADPRRLSAECPPAAGGAQGR